MTTPIWPQVIYPIGQISDGGYYAIVGKQFNYCRDLPDLSEAEWDDTDPDIHVEWDVEDTHTCV